MGDFIGHHELLVLSSEAIANKKAIFDFDGTDHVLGELHIHLLYDLLLMVLHILLASTFLATLRRSHSHHLLLLLLHHHLLLLFLYMK